MLRMAFEREVITSIRSRVDAYDERCLFNDSNTSAVRPHIRLGSLDTAIHLESYAKKISIDIDLQDLQTLLTKFLHLNHALIAEDTDISGFQVRDSHICWLSIYLRRWFPVM